MKLVYQEKVPNEQSDCVIERKSYFLRSKLLNNDPYVSCELKGYWGYAICM